jgi:uncharacterized protein YjcR
VEDVEMLPESEEQNEVIHKIELVWNVDFDEVKKKIRKHMNPTRSEGFTNDVALASFKKNQ